MEIMAPEQLCIQVKVLNTARQLPRGAAVGETVSGESFRV